MDNWYILFIRTGKEKSYMKDIRQYNEEKCIDNINPFVPMKETFFKKNGERITEVSIMFPGYMFIETAMDSYEFANYVKIFQRTYNDSLKVLSYGDSKEIAVNWKERLMLMKLMNHEWYVKTSWGYKENGKVKITEGPLVNFEGKIVKIDRHKMKAWVEIEILNKITDVELGLQVLNKVDYEISNSFK